MDEIKENGEKAADGDPKMWKLMLGEVCAVQVGNNLKVTKARVWLPFSLILDNWIISGQNLYFLGA